MITTIHIVTNFAVLQKIKAVKKTRKKQSPTQYVYVSSLAIF